MSKSSRFVFSLALPVFAVASGGCGGGSPQPQTPPPTTATPPTSPGGDTTTTAAASNASTATPGTPEKTAPATPPGPAPIFHVTGMSTPESVLYDEANDRYLVSNVNGKPADVDNNGYISVVSPDGKMTTEKWIAGGQNKVTLNAPKGSAIANGMFYVADLDTVRIFDLKSGAPKGEVKIPGATFLNDMAAGEGGKVYVTDSGVKPNGAGMDPTGTDAVYAIEKGNKLKTIAKDTALGKPNGIVIGPTGPWVVTIGTGEIYRLDEKGKRQDVQKLPKGMLDGIVMMGDVVYVSSWEAQGIFKGKPGGTWDLAFTGMKSPADIGLDKKRSRILVPNMMENALDAYEIK